MTQVNIGDVGGEVCAITAGTGVLIPCEGNLGGTLASGTTYFYPVGDKDSTYKSIHLKWDAAVIVTFTLWCCDFPKYLANMGGGVVDTSDISQVAGDWLQINPANATVYIDNDAGTHVGTTVTNLTIAVAGGTANGAVIDLGNVPSKRLRIRAVVGGTGGKVRCCTHGKE